MTPLVLASTSPARRELLMRLGLPFEVAAPLYHEVPACSVAPGELALRHSVGKARSLASRFPARIVIGSDQVAELDGEVIGKPGSPEMAVSQLLRMAGRWVAFHTGLALIRDGREETRVETYEVRLRRLVRREAETYVAKDHPLSCAGSFRIEGLGIALMDELRGADYTSLIGLPLIGLTSLLERFGVRVLGPTG